MTPTISVLIVDDERAVRQLLIQGLHQNDYLIDEASDGLEALAKLGATEFDLVISDIAMPKMDGLRLLAEIKKNHPETCVILMTGYPGEYASQLALKTGADYYVTKPFTDSEIFHAVSSFAKRKRAQSERHNATRVTCSG
jgi:YesN/AraC family two-component response regulator